MSGANDAQALRAARRQRLALLLLWLIPAIWSSNYLIARAATTEVSPHALALGRWCVALLLMLPLTGRALWLQRQQWWPEWPRMLVLGALGMWVCGAFVYQGGQSTSATNIGLIYAASPVGIAVVSRRVLGERVRPLQSIAMCLALAGVLYVIAKGDWQTLASVSFSMGDLWIVAAAMSWVAYSVLQQYWRSSLGAGARLAAITAGGIVVLLPFTLLEAWGAWPGAVGQWPTPKGWWLVFAAAIFPGYLSYHAYAFMGRELGATRSSLVLYLAPVYAAVSAWILLGEPVKDYHLIGAALILPSIALATRSPTPLTAPMPKGRSR